MGLYTLYLFVAALWWTFAQNVRKLSTPRCLRILVSYTATLFKAIPDISAESKQSREHNHAMENLNESQDCGWEANALSDEQDLSGVHRKN